MPLPESPYTEAETRVLFIDELLREAGWDPEAPNVAEYPVTGMPQSTNPQGNGYVDYVLWGADGKPLAVVEAKRTMRNAEEGRVQAGLYADCLERMHHQRPVIFYTNGFEIWIWDDTFSSPRPVQGIYTRDELQRLGGPAAHPGGHPQHAGGSRPSWSATTSGRPSSAWPRPSWPSTRGNCAASGGAPCW